MADRQEFQGERRRLLRDPEAGDHSEFPDTAESVQADREVDPFSDVPFEDDDDPLAVEPEPQTGVLVSAHVTPGGLLVELLIPLEAVSFHLAQQEQDGAEA